jgi:hypothetical protein
LSPLTVIEWLRSICGADSEDRLHGLARFNSVFMSISMSASSLFSVVDVVDVLVAELEARIGSTWSGCRKPTIAPSTAGLRNAQATATGVVSCAPSAEAVRGGGIDPVDAQLKGALDRSNEVLVLL